MPRKRCLGKDAWEKMPGKRCIGKIFRKRYQGIDAKEKIPKTRCLKKKKREMPKDANLKMPRKKNKMPTIAFKMNTRRV